MLWYSGKWAITTDAIISVFWSAEQADLPSGSGVLYGPGTITRGS